VRARGDRDERPTSRHRRRVARRRTGPAVRVGRRGADARGLTASDAPSGCSVVAALHEVRAKASSRIPSKRTASG
jgi:hypothetical protein